MIRIAGTKMCQARIFMPARESLEDLGTHDLCQPHNDDEANLVILARPEQAWIICTVWKQSNSISDGPLSSMAERRFSKPWIRTSPGFGLFSTIVITNSHGHGSQRGLTDTRVLLTTTATISAFIGSKLTCPQSSERVLYFL